jgi:hypothetical protein
VAKESFDCIAAQNRETARVRIGEGHHPVYRLGVVAEGVTTDCLGWTTSSLDLVVAVVHEKVKRGVPAPFDPEALEEALSLVTTMPSN